jgi:hypothetical protein
MSYISKQFSAASAIEQTRKVLDFLEYDLGYVVYDEISSSEKTFKMNYSDNYCPFYLYVYEDSNHIKFRLYLYWDLDTHAGDYEVYNTNWFLTASNNEIIYCHGNEYWCIVTSNITTYANKYNNPNYSAIFGEIPVLFDPTVTKITASGISGDNAILYVEDSSDFYVGVTYQLIGSPDSKCRRMVEIATIPNSTSLTVTNLPVTVISGSYLGAVPCKAFCRGDSSEIERVFGYFDADSVDDTTHEKYEMSFSSAIEDKYMDPDFRQNVWFMTTNYLYDRSGSVIGYFDSDLLSQTNGDTGDLYCVPINTGSVNSSVSSGTLITLTDDTKSWEVDEHKDRYVVIIDGPGVGEVKKIVSNTSITLNVCSFSVGDLADELLINGYGKETDGLSIDVVDNGVESGDSASASYVGDKTIEVEIDSGNTTQSTIATALEGVNCIRSVTVDNPTDTWSTASGINTVTISGGDGSFWEIVPTVMSSYAIYEEAWRDCHYYTMKADY